MQNVQRWSELFISDMFDVLITKTFICKERAKIVIKMFETLRRLKTNTRNIISKKTTLVYSTKFTRNLN